jgi:hypothetical protein
MNHSSPPPISPGTPPTAGVSRNRFLRTLGLGLPLLPFATAGAQQPATGETLPAPDLGNLRAFVELARSDIRTQKALIIAENLTLTGDEAFEFWPTHRDYETELGALLDRRLELITRYARQYETLTDQDATKLANEVFDLEGRRTSLKRKYFKKFSKLVSARKAARFFQLENQLNMVLDLQVAAALPLIK